MHVIFGATPGNREIPDPADNTGRELVLKNTSSVDVTLTGTVANSFFTFEVKTTIILIPGQMVRLLSDGVYWQVN